MFGYYDKFEQFLILCIVGLLLALVPMFVKYVASKRLLVEGLDKKQKKKIEKKINNMVDWAAFFITICLLVVFARFMYNMAMSIFAIVSPLI